MNVFIEDECDMNLEQFEASKFVEEGVLKLFTFCGVGLIDYHSNRWLAHGREFT